MKELDNLIEGNRYMFYYKEGAYNKSTWFRAIFVSLVKYNQYETLIVKKYDPSDGPRKNEIWYITTELISHCESLPDILKNQRCILPDDVLLEIDNYF